MPVMAAVGSTVGQGVVTRSGSRRVAVASMVLLGLGTAWLTQVSGHGSYLTEIFVGLLVFGPGVGAGYVAGSAASLEGASEAEAGLASGLNNASFQIGAAVGVAIVSSVASSHAVLTEGAQAGFAAAIVFAVLGLAAAVALLGRRRAGVALDPEPAAA
jgi:MFS family permease